MKYPKPSKMPEKEIKKKVKSKRQLLTLECDKLFRAIVRTRSNFTCNFCQEKKYNKHSQTAHIFSRGHIWTRWNLRNALCLCYYHHILDAHRHPLEFAERVKEYIGQETYEELRKLSLKSEPMYINDLENIRDGLKEEWKKYSGTLVIFLEKEHK